MKSYTIVSNMYGYDCNPSYINHCDSFVFQLKFYELFIPLLTLPGKLDNIKLFDSHVVVCSSCCAQRQTSNLCVTILHVNVTYKCVGYSVWRNATLQERRVGHTMFVQYTDRIRNAPIIFLTIYICLSISFLMCLPSTHPLFLGLVIALQG